MDVSKREVVESVTRVAGYADFVDLQAWLTIRLKLCCYEYQGAGHPGLAWLLRLYIIDKP